MLICFYVLYFVFSVSWLFVCCGTLCVCVCLLQKKLTLGVNKDLSNQICADDLIFPRSWTSVVSLKMLGWCPRIMLHSTRRFNPPWGGRRSDEQSPGELHPLAVAPGEGHAVDRVEDGDGVVPVGALGPGHHAEAAVPGTPAVQHHALLQAYQKGLPSLPGGHCGHKQPVFRSISFIRVRASRP